MSLLDRKAGAASVDPDDFNAVVDAVVALGGNVVARKAGAAAVDCDDFNAVIDAAVTLGSNLRARKAGAATVDTDDFNALIDGVYTLQQTPTSETWTQVSTVSVTASLNLGDGLIYIAGKGLYSNSVGRSLLRWQNPGTDLATFDTVAFANDGKHNGAVGMFYDAGTNGIYVCFNGYLGGDDFWHILISKVDVDSLAVTTFVDIQLYDSNVIAVGPGAGNICTDGTSLYLITHTSATFGPDTQVRKYLLADGSLTATRTITGFQHGHPIAWNGGFLYGGGTSPANNGWAFRMADDLSSHSTVALAAATCTVCDDIVIYGNYFWLQDETKTNPARIWRIKKDLSTVDTVTLTGGGTSAVCDGFLDNTAVDGTIKVGMRNGDKIASVDATTLVEGTAFATTGVTAINEIVRGGSNIYITTYESTSKVSRVAIT